MTIYASCIAVLAGTALLTASLPEPAHAMPIAPVMEQTASTMLTDVQFRGGRGGFRRFHGGGLGGHRFNGGFGHRGYGFRGGGYRYGFRGGRGAAIGAGVAGLAAGALIGGALASQAAPGYGYGPGYADAAPPVPVTGDASAYCAQRFRSYDPGSGTYLGYDGLRHPCP